MTEKKSLEYLNKLHSKIVRSPFAKNVTEQEMLALIEGKKTLEEVQQYRALGTVEELRVARDKQVAKKPIYKEMPYSEEVGFNEEWHCPVCGAYIGYCTEGMSEPEQMEYCNECGQHIAKDWSDEDE